MQTFEAPVNGNPTDTGKYVVVFSASVAGLYAFGMFHVSGDLVKVICPEQVGTSGAGAITQASSSAPHGPAGVIYMASGDTLRAWSDNAVSSFKFALVRLGDELSDEE